MTQKNAIITGASRGIGLAIAKYLAGEGYNLDLIARDPDRLEAAKKAISDEYSNIQINAHSLDLVNAQESYNLVSSICKDRGHIDVVINNAGVLITGCSEVDIDAFKKIFDVNVHSVFAIAKAAAEQMKKQNDGHIINLASKAGKRGLAKLGAYCATKFAVVGLSESLYNELLPYNVKVTAICPSAIDTEMTRDFGMANSDKISTHDIVNTVAYLLSLSPSAVMSSIDVDCKAIVIGGLP